MKISIRLVPPFTAAAPEPGRRSRPALGAEAGRAAVRDKGGSVSPQNRGRRAAAPPAGAWGDLPVGRGSERPAPPGRAPAPAGLCSLWAGGRGWRRNPGHPRSPWADEGDAAKPSLSPWADDGAARPSEERRPPKEGGREGAREGEAPAASNPNSKDATSVFAGASLAAGTGWLRPFAEVPMKSTRGRSRRKGRAADVLGFTSGGGSLHECVGTGNPFASSIVCLY